MPEMFEDFLEADTIPVDKPHLEDDSEMLFIHSHDDLIEKVIGEEEAIFVQKTNIVAFTDKIQFEPQLAEIIKVKGPGILYIETSRDERVTSMRSNLLQP